MMYQKNVTDAEVKTNWDHVFVTEIKDLLVPRIIMGCDEGKQDETKKAEQKGKGHAQQPTSEQRQLLENIYERPNLPVTKRTAMLGLSPYKMNKIKNSVIEKKLAEQFSINLGKNFGGNITLLALTDEGYRAIGKRQVSKRQQNESLEHWWWKGQVHRSYSARRIPSEIEKFLCGKHADVGIIWKGRDIAIEIELSTKNAITNIVQDLDASFDRVLCCCKDRRIESSVIRQFESYKDHVIIKDKVTFRLLSEFEFLKEIAKS